MIKQCISLAIILSSYTLADAQSSSSQIVITQHGVFENCSTAVNYRDNILTAQLDTALKNYSKKTLRYDEAIQDLKDDIQIADKKYNAATPELARKIAHNVAKAAALKALSKIQAIPKNIRDSLSETDLKILEETIEFSRNNQALVVKAARGENIVLPDIFKNLIEPLVKIHPAGATIATIFSVSEAVLYPIWDWKIVRNESSQISKILAKSLSRMERRHPRQIVKSVNFVKNEIDNACNQTSTSSLVDIARSIASSEDPNLPKQSALDYLRDIIDTGTSDDLTQHLVTTALDAVLGSEEDETVPADIILELIGAKDASKTIEDESDPEKEVEDEQPAYEKSELQKKLESHIQADLDSRTECVLSGNIEVCQPLPEGRIVRPSYEDDIGDAAIVLDQMGSDIGLQAPQEAGDFLELDEFEGHTRGITENIVGRVCDENNNCTIQIKKIRPIRASGN